MIVFQKNVQEASGFTLRWRLREAKGKTPSGWTSQIKAKKGAIWKEPIAGGYRTDLFVLSGWSASKTTFYYNDSSGWTCPDMTPEAAGDGTIRYRLALNRLGYPHDTIISAVSAPFTGIVAPWDVAWTPALTFYKTDGVTYPPYDNIVTITDNGQPEIAQPHNGSILDGLITNPNTPEAYKRIWSCSHGYLFYVDNDNVWVPDSNETESGGMIRMWGLNHRWVMGHVFMAEVIPDKVILKRGSVYAATPAISGDTYAAANPWDCEWHKVDIYGEPIGSITVRKDIQYQ